MSLSATVSLRCRLGMLDLFDEQWFEHALHLNGLGQFVEPRLVDEHARSKLRFVEQLDRDLAEFALHGSVAGVTATVVRPGPGTCRPRFGSYTMRERAGRITITPCNWSMVMSISSPGVSRKYLRTSGGNTTPHVPPTFQ